ncbi:MAG: SsrA-binding protein SmpB [Planctomycetota bacterium]|jgi:SsrA-binding protein
MSDNRVVIARNRRAYRNFEIEEKFECGLVLLGPEVKSLRAGKVSIAEAFALFRGEELFICDMHIAEYTHTGYTAHDPVRPRKLLMHRRELRKLQEQVERKGLTLVPIEIYFKKGRAKLEMAIAKGRRRHDKREAVAKEDARREARRAEGRRR